MPRLPISFAGKVQRRYANLLSLRDLVAARAARILGSCGNLLWVFALVGPTLTHRTISGKIRMRRSALSNNHRKDEVAQPGGNRRPRGETRIPRVRQSALGEWERAHVLTTMRLPVCDSVRTGTDFEARNPNLF